VISIVGDSFPGKIILHWFSGTQRQAEQAILNGYYFSFNLSMLESKNGQLLINSIPRNRVLTESDGPFISINNEPSHPGHIPQIVSRMSKLLKAENEELKNHISENFRNLLTI
jgi:TatD DNase family protein